MGVKEIMLVLKLLEPICLPISKEKEEKSEVVSRDNLLYNRRNKITDNTTVIMTSSTSAGKKTNKMTIRFHVIIANLLCLIQIQFIYCRLTVNISNTCGTHEI